MNGRNRRRKDVPFNPFAQNAAAERNRRHAEKAKEKRRLDAQNQTTGPANIGSQKVPAKSLEDLQREAREKLAADVNTAEPTVVDKKESITAPTPVVEESKKVVKEEVPTITQTTAAKPSVSTKQSREERLAELKRKSQQSRDNAKLNKAPAKVEADVQPEVIIQDEADTELLENEAIDIIDSGIEDKNQTRNLNVFKTIQTVDKSSAGISKKKRKTRRMDKKGGGRQRLEKKLKSNKILEFKYVAREILSHPDVPEQHRSNVLGQIIAKGERISIDAAIEFIDQKNLELVLTDEISDKLKSEIKSISTRR